jgi:hypothetical protein
MVFATTVRGAVFVGSLVAAIACGQQVTVTTPWRGASDGFYEGFGVRGGWHWPGPNGASIFPWGPGVTPPFAPGFGPSPSFGGGFGVRGTGGGFGLNFFGASGSHSSLSMDSASLTIPNGGVGYIQDATIYPFVTGFVPVVGDFRSSPLTERLARLHAGESAASAPTIAPPTAGPATGALAPSTTSSAERGDISVAEIRRQRSQSSAAEQDALAQMIGDAQEAEASGRYGAARVRYRQAAARAEGDLKAELLRRLDALREK